MIGVIAKADQRRVVEEFFELFKTPWEPYQDGRPYDVVITSVAEIPEVKSGLILIFDSEGTSCDDTHGIVGRTRLKSACIDLEDRGHGLPIYGDLLTFERVDGASPCLTAGGHVVGLRVETASHTTIRLGYDLFREVASLISKGQPVEHAHIPTLDVHISMLRDWILGAGIPLVEVLPTPSSHPFMVCLTHDIDFVGIRRHFCDHTMWGFLYRSTCGSVRNLVRRRISARQLLQTWWAVASLPFVYLGWAKDFWSPFEWYVQAEQDVPATYFLIPFKGRAGVNVPGPHGSRRATAYDVTDIPYWTATLETLGCELGVHGIDAWHSVEKGRSERGRLPATTGEPGVGIRMHWLLHDENTASVLESAGYAYDSSVGYNETVGYRSGTSQVYRPVGAERLLELPLHIQDGALFYPQRLDLSAPEADKRCGDLVRNASQFGGVLTVLWHDRSHGPERFWGAFYVRLIRTLKSSGAWFGTAGQVVAWFRKRREVRFEHRELVDGVRTSLHYDGEAIVPSLRVRLYHSSVEAASRTSSSATGATFSDIHWNGKTVLEWNTPCEKLAELFPA